MPVKTGTFEALGVSYESGTNASLLSAIARSAEELTSGKGWPDGVNDLLAALGRATGVSRVWIFQTVSLTPNHITQNYTFEWAAAPQYKQLGMPMFSMFTNIIDRPGYRDMIASRKRGEWQKVITQDLEPGWLLDSQVVQRIESMLTIPVMVEDQWWGTLGFDDCERAYDWSDVEIALLRTAGYLISNAVLRDRLTAKRRQFDILKELTDSSAWEFDFRTGQVWCSADLLYSMPMPMENVRLSLRNALRWVHPEDRRPLLHDLRVWGDNEEGVLRRDVRLFTDCGDVRWVEILGNLRRNEDGKPVQFAGIAVDIRARKQEEQRLREEAVTDPLTGVLNRRMFEQQLREQIERTFRGRGAFAMLLLDLDRFKVLNDTWGHLEGDAVLRQFATLCQAALRSMDIVARLGGDEFAVLLPDAGAKTARAVGERIRENVQSAVFAVGQETVDVTVSIGMTVHAAGLITPARIIESADMALYEAKRLGRNRLMDASEMA